MIKPVGHRVLVKPFDVETKTDFGIIIITDEAREFAAQEYGTIVEVGPDAWKDFGERPWAEVGDKVIYSKYGGKIVRAPKSNDKYVILNDEDILAKLIIEVNEDGE